MTFEDCRTAIIGHSGKHVLQYSKNLEWGATMIKKLSVLRLFSKILLALFVLCSFALLIPEDFNTLRLSPHAGELTEKTRVDGRTHITGFYNSKGELTDPVDRHFASHTETYDADGRLVAEDYYHADGSPAEQPKGFTGIRYDYSTDRDVQVTYVDGNDEPMIIAPGYVYIQRKLNAMGDPEEEYYLDLDQEPVACRDGFYGIRFAYDEKGSNTEQTFLDADGKPMQNKNGVTREKYLRNKQDQNIREMYFDEKDQPVQAPLGNYGVAFERDDRDRPTKFTYLDVNGHWMVNHEGYTIMTRTYRPDGSKQTDRYYDHDEKPVALASGQYGVYHTSEYGQNIYLDKNGGAQLSLNNIFHYQPYIVVVIGILLCVFFALAPEKLCYITAAVYLGFIVYMTLLFRNTVETKTNFDLSTYVARLLYSFESRSEIVNNIWLFIPFGAFLRRKTEKRRWILAAFFLSLLVETAQLLTGFGTFELNDLIGNTLGGCIGFYITEGFLEMQVYWRKMRDLRRVIPEEEDEEDTSDLFIDKE